MSRAVVVPRAVRAIAKKRRWSRADAKQVIVAGERSGLSWSRFAEQLGVGLWRIGWWRSRFADSRRRERTPAIEFVPVTPMLSGRDGRAELELTLTNGHRLRIGAAVPPELVSTVLKSVMC